MDRNNNYVETSLSLDEEVNNTKHQLDSIKYELGIGRLLRVEFIANYVDVGYAELSLAEDLLEIRWVEVYEIYKSKGYLGKIVKKLLELGYIMFGEVVDVNLKEIWENVGANFVTDWTFVISKEGK